MRHENLSDQQLVAEITRLAVAERRATAALISALAEHSTNRGSSRPRTREQGGLRRTRVMSRRPFGGRFGHGMKAVASLKDRRAVARRPVSSKFTTSCRTLPVVRRRSRTWSFAAPRTTGTRQNSILVSSFESGSQRTSRRRTRRASTVSPRREGARSVKRSTGMIVLVGSSTLKAGADLVAALHTE